MVLDIYSQERCHKRSASEGINDTHINNHCGGTSDDNKNGAQKTALRAIALRGLEVTH